MSGSVEDGGHGSVREVTDGARPSARMLDNEGGERRARPRRGDAPFLSDARDRYGVGIAIGAGVAVAVPAVRTRTRSAHIAMGALAFVQPFLQLPLNSALGVLARDAGLVAAYLASYASGDWE